MITARVFFGNNNSLLIDLQTNTLAGELIAALTFCMNAPIDDILFIIVNSTLLEKSNYDKPLYTFDIVDNRCNVFVVLNGAPTHPIDSSVRVIVEQNKYWLRVNHPGLASRLKIGERAPEQHEFEDVTVVIPEVIINKYLMTHELSEQQASDPTYQCAVCYETEEGPRSILCCGHIFHSACIKKWLTEKSVKCPICNCDVREQVPAEFLVG